MNGKDFREDIDGLRAIAVTAVVFYHFGFASFSGGFVGVDVFFVISGYLITRNVVTDCNAGSFRLWDFYFRRVRRTIPALVVMILTVLTCAPLLLLPSDLEALGRSAAAALFNVSNWYFYFNTGYFDQASSLMPLLHTWSLGVEWQFYLVWPLLIVSVFHRGPRQLALAIAAFGVLSFIANIFIVALDPEQAFYLPFTRAWQLVVGGLLVFVPAVRSALLSVLALILISLSIIGLDHTAQYPGLAALLPTLGAGLAIASPIRLLAAYPLVVVGRASYSLYLWHWPVLAWFIYRYGHPPSGLWEIAVTGSVIAGLTALSWYAVEVSFLRRKASRPSQVVVATMLGLTVLSLIPLWFVQSDGLPQRFTKQELLLINDMPRRGVLDEAGRTCSSRSPMDPCQLGNEASEPTWALIGDSHAETLMAAVDAEWKQRGVSGLVFTLPGCPFIQGVRRLDTGMDCGSFVESTLTEIRKHNIRHVIVQDRANAYLVGKPFDNEEGGIEPGPSIAVAADDATANNRIEATSNALLRTLDRLLDDDREVVYLLAPPEVGWNAPQKALEAMRTKAGPVTTSLDVYMRRNKPLMDILERAQDKELTVVPSYRAFCDSETKRCQIDDQAGLLYTDTDHLSDLGARRLVDLVFRYRKQRLAAQPE